MVQTAPKLTSDEITLVQTTFSKVLHISDAAADLFYNRLFELDPSIRPMFSDDMTEQKKKLMATLKTVVFSLRQLGTIVPAIQDLGQRHARYKVEDRHYELVGSALLWALEQGLAKDWNLDVKNAWVSAYTLIATTMKDAAANVKK
jgi:hemoglobin-like flavoprotein